MRRLFLWVLILLLGAAMPAAAQGVRPEITFAYQWQHVSSGAEDTDETLSQNFPLGFNVDAAFPVMGDLSVVGQFDWSHASPSEIGGESLEGTGVEMALNMTAYAGGVRWSSKSNPSVAPYVQVLLGGAHSSASYTVDGEAGEDIPSEDNFMLQLGGGVAIPLNAKADVIGQFDYRRLFSSDGTNVIRLLGGIRIKL
jgi:hypothetical protein